MKLDPHSPKQRLAQKQFLDSFLLDIRAHNIERRVIYGQTGVVDSNRKITDPPPVAWNG